MPGAGINVRTKSALVNLRTSKNSSLPPFMGARTHASSHKDRDNKGPLPDRDNVWGRTTVVNLRSSRA